MLVAIGCVERLSAAPANANTLSSVYPPSLTICTTLKFPSVTVPVLSMTTAFTAASDSRETPPLNKIPFLEPAPIPAKKASGTLRTSAQGQLITRKVSAVYIQ